MFIWFSWWLSLYMTMKVQKGRSCVCSQWWCDQKSMYGFIAATPNRTVTAAFVLRVTEWIDCVLLKLKSLIWKLVLCVRLGSSWRNCRRLKQWLIPEKLIENFAVLPTTILSKWTVWQGCRLSTVKGPSCSTVQNYKLEQKQCLNLSANVKWLRVHFS